MRRPIEFTGLHGQLEIYEGDELLAVADYDSAYGVLAVPAPRHCHPDRLINRPDVGEPREHQLHLGNVHEGDMIALRLVIDVRGFSGDIA